MEYRKNDTRCRKPPSRWSPSDPRSPRWCSRECARPTSRKITIEIANLRDVPAEIEEKVIEECHQIFMARQYISQGGVDFAAQILEKAVGRQQGARDHCTGSNHRSSPTAFRCSKILIPSSSAAFFQNEHPQTIVAGHDPA